MKWLVTSDLHLTDRAKDAYRFDLFPWLATQQRTHNTTATFILGDLTDAKDKHSSTLVNKIVDGLYALKPPVYILRGNHDCIDPENPFFGFLNYINDIVFINNEFSGFLEGVGEVTMIPHCRSQAEFDEACKFIKKNDAIFLHNTFDGAIAETGSRLSGLRASLVDLKGPRGVWAGDIHKPQQCGPVTYVGSPYQIRFGDNFEPRVLLINDGKSSDLKFKCPKKWSLKITSDYDIIHNEDLKRGDQLKLTIALTREEFPEWTKLKSSILTVCREKGLEVHGFEIEILGSRQVVKQNKKGKTNEEVFKGFCQSENIGSLVKKAGMEILGLV